MPEGTIQSFDAESERGEITPSEGGSAVPFDGSDVEDRQPGEALQPGKRVTYRVEGEGGDEKAVNVRHVADRGYGG